MNLTATFLNIVFLRALPGAGRRHGPEEAFGRSGPGDVGVGGVVVRHGLQVALGPAESHGDAVVSRSVAASAPAVDLIIIDSESGQTCDTIKQEPC